MSRKVQLTWRDAPGSPPEPSPDPVRVLSLALSWPRDLAGEHPDAPLDGPLRLEDVLLHLRELDPRKDGDGVHDPLATFRLTVEVDPAGAAGVLEAEDVSGSDDLPAGWRVAPPDGPRPGVRSRVQLHLPGPGGVAGPTLSVDVLQPDAEERLAPGATTGQEGSTYEIGACLRRRAQPAGTADLASARTTVALAVDDPVLSPFVVAAIQQEHRALWLLGVNAGNGGVTDVCDARQVAVDGLRALDAAWEPPPPYRGPGKVTTAEIIGQWLQATVNGSDWRIQYCGVTAGRILLGAGAQPHWVGRAGQGQGFLSTLRIRMVMSYRDDVSTRCGVPVRVVDGVTTPCAAREAVEDVISIAEFHRRSGARRLLLDIGNGYDTSAPRSRPATRTIDPGKVAAREALFFEQEGRPARVRAGDVLIVGNDWETAGSKNGKHVTILEGACRGGACGLCARDGLDAAPGPFLHLLEGNPAQTREGSYQLWDPALERELDLESGRVRDGRGVIEDGVDIRTEEGQQELAARRLRERGVARGSPEWERIAAAFVLAVKRARRTTHLARRRRPLKIFEQTGRDSAVIYAARLSPLDFGHVPLVELRDRRRLLDQPRPDAELPAWVAALGDGWRSASEAHRALLLGGPRGSMKAEEWRASVAKLRRPEGTDEPLARARARVAAGLARVDRPDLVQWPSGAPELGAMGCVNLPFALAVWAGQLRAADEQLLTGRSVEVEGLGTDCMVEALGMLPAAARTPERRWPESCPRAGDVVVFGDTERSDYRHVAVATGEGETILSLEPGKPGAAAPLLRTTISRYLEDARALDGGAGPQAYYAPWAY